MLIYAATGNVGKLRELQAICQQYGWSIEPYAAYVEPEETADTYEGNALIKARALRSQLALAGVTEAVIADDSGLEIDALDGRPGIHSARYGGEKATWADRRTQLLEEVRQGSSRDLGARFVCAIAFIATDGEITVTRGVAEGELTEDERGDLGFSYDPIFYDVDECATYAELAQARKNLISHRAKAIAELHGTLRTT